MPLVARFTGTPSADCHRLKGTMMHDTDTDDGQRSRLWPYHAPNPGTEWMEHAKCATTPPPAGRDPFDLAGAPNKARKALQACSWCPVMRECAQHTLHVGRDEGVVRAGTWIPSHVDGLKDMPAVIARLERIAGVGQVAA